MPTRNEAAIDAACDKLGTSLHSLFVCDFATGTLVWSARGWEGPRNKQWNARYAGKPAITARLNNGYMQGTVMGKHVLAHRLIWKLAFNVWPAKLIDHINGDPSDNRLVNLREADFVLNARNCSKQSGEYSSRFKGVFRHQDGFRWRAQIYLNRLKRKRLGIFATEEEAALAYNKAAVEYFGAYAKLNEVACKPIRIPVEV